MAAAYEERGFQLESYQLHPFIESSNLFRQNETCTRIILKEFNCQYVPQDRSPFFFLLFGCGLATA